MAEWDLAERAIIRLGGPEEHARLRWFLHAELAPQDVIEALFGAQRGDGGWAPFWAPHDSSVDATCFRLAKAWQVGLKADSDQVSRGLRFLLERQKPDGSWEELASLAAVAPPWALPGDRQASLYLTANAAYWVAMYDGPEEGARRAASWLESHMEEGGRIPSFLQAQWLAGGLFWRLGNETAATRALDFLLGQVNSQLPPSNVAWLLTTVLDAGLLPDHPVVSRSCDLLLEQKRPDGLWPGEQGGDSDLHTTLEALRALHMC